MDKGSFAKFLIVLVLISGTLSGCLSGKNPGTPESSTSPQTSPSPATGPVSSPISPEVKQKFKDLKNDYKNYAKSQDKLISSLPPQVNNSNVSQINTKDVSDQLEKFAQASQNFYQALQSLDKQDRKDKIFEQLKQLDQTQTELSSKVLKPLETGLQKLAIQEVQKNLNLLQDGIWGGNTKQSIVEFLQNNANKLASNIQDLDKEINSDGTLTKTDSKTPSPRSSTTPTPSSSKKSIVSPEQVKDLTEQVNYLTYRLNYLTDQVNNVNNFKLVSFISLVVAILAVVLSISMAVVLSNSIKKFKKTKENSLGQGQAQPNNRYSSTQMNQEDYNQIYGQLFKDISQELYHYFTKIINNYFEQLEQRQAGSKVNDYQENKSFLGKPEQVKKDAISTKSSILSARGSVSKQTSSQSSKLVVNYNQNTRDFLKSATVVSETEESINNRRLGSSQPVVLEESRKGNYCIIKDAGVNYMVPKENLKINQYNYNTVEVLFECPGYQSGYSSNFRLAKPASVSPTSGNKWLLIERGILEFSSSSNDIYYGSPM